MSSASTWVCWITSASLARAADPALASALWGMGGWISRSSRCRVQSPARSTLVGIPGSGTIDPTDSPVPLNSKLVT